VLTEFLKNPISQGVWHLRLSVPVSAIEELHEWIRLKFTDAGKQTPPSLKELRSWYDLQPQQLIPPRISVDALSIYLLALTQDPALHTPLTEWVRRKGVRNYNQSPYSVLEPRLALVGSLDVLSGYALDLKDSVIIDAVSLNENPIDEFERLLASLPGFGNRIKRLTRRKKHGSSYVNRAYALSTHLWLASEESGPVPEAAVQFLEPSLTYYDVAQWRTSIVLSAICVEYILAEMFEETFKSAAPEIPLGPLYEKVSAKKQFPVDQDTGIRRTNEIRIKAVHRGVWLASDRDALDALMGAVQLIIWHYVENV
jgi:hypothetical protein